jgi:hypothetical protein
MAISVVLSSKSGSRSNQMAIGKDLASERPQELPSYVFIAVREVSPKRGADEARQHNRHLHIYALMWSTT